MATTTAVSTASKLDLCDNNMEKYHDLDRYQDILGQLPMLQVYSHILYMFPMPKNGSREDIIRNLEKAIVQVREKVPWMGSRVVNVGKGPGNSGLYRVIACSRPEKPIDVKDASDAMPSYSAINERKAPVSMLDSKMLTPVPAFPERFEDSDENPAYVTRLQATFIEGGLILDFCIHHNIADAGGHFGFVRLMAMVMSGKEIPESLLAHANRDRRNLFPLLSPDEPMLDHSHHKRPPITENAPLVKPEPAKYHILRFTPAKLVKLKELASQPEGFDPKVPFITTDDALSAFCWQRLVKVRSHNFPPDTRSRFSRAIDGRKMVGIAPEYMGDVIHNVATFMTFKELVESPLSTVASLMRKRLNESSNAHHLRSFATFIAKEPDKSTITYGGHFNPATDVGCSSIRARADLFPDFGTLGKPDFIRRPPTTLPFPSLLIFFPGNTDGDCDASACLTDMDFEALNKDPLWTEFVEYIG